MCVFVHIYMYIMMWSNIWDKFLREDAKYKTVYSMLILYMR